MKSFVAISALSFTLLGVSAARQPSNMSNTIEIKHIARDLQISDLGNDAWNTGKEVEIGTYWSGEKAPAGRHFKARLLWSETALYIRFESNQSETLVISNKPDLSRKTMNLWNGDVCEIFIAPDRSRPNKYYEFEVAPTGEWIDVAIEALPEKRVTDFDYASGMKAAARIEVAKVVSGIKIEWKAFGKRPKAGDVWLSNLFRCVGHDPTRGYLAWQPTLTKTPDFHVPSKFGDLKFVH